jgi:hypothetical protein
MPAELTDLQLDEISLVDRGANQHAGIVFSKRAHVDDAEAYRLASKKGDPPQGENMHVEKTAEQLDAAVSKAVAGKNREQIHTHIEKRAGEENLEYSKFLDTEEGSRLYSAYNSAPLMAPVTKVEKIADVAVNKADAMVHRLAMAHRKASKGRLTYAQAYDQALKNNPHLAPKAIDNQEPDSDDIAKVDAELISLAKAAA